MEDYIIPKKKISKAALKGWTKEDKYHLLGALKAYGLYDIERIKTHVSTKTFEETKLAVDYFKSVALQHPIFEKKRQHERTKSIRRPRIPLSAWSKILTDSLSFEELQTETITAVRMIADLDKIPSAVYTENIDFRQIYHYVANAMEGKPISPDSMIAAILHKCVTETALSSRTFIQNATHRYLVNTDLSDKEIHMTPKPTKDQELAILRHLSSQRKYNPFMVREEFLKPDVNEPVNEI